ncbi:c-type cytochrome [Psychrobacter sp. P11G3]|uniref:c-type cytochrome n=1 Tax=Psychrobacter sp. P11G3 TaxID=1699623 RepID=UPI0007092438|nr:cytochrome c [Psychrobacter sp. P11G3]KRG32762.1 cytochrome C oxidase Cbb3 [Psychrobacter sp. P11G3]
MNIVVVNPNKPSSSLRSSKAIMMLMVGGSIALTTLSGCSQYKAENLATIAHPQTTPMVFDNNFDNQSSRNQGAWGGVYMSKNELAKPTSNIVDVRSIPKMSDDASMQQWLTKFEGSTQGKTGFFTTNGKKLYDDSCAGCHMQKGDGAQGAGYYPPLADNSKMQSKYYIISVVINGLRGMPSFHRMMSDEQIAAVTQYVHSDLNNFTDIVNAANVAQLRHDFPPGSDPSE